MLTLIELLSSLVAMRDWRPPDGVEYVIVVRPLVHLYRLEAYIKVAGRDAVGWTFERAPNEDVFRSMTYEAEKMKRGEPAQPPTVGGMAELIANAGRDQ